MATDTRTKTKLPAARYGASAYESSENDLPTQYPRTMGPNVMKYLQAVVDSGLSRNGTMVDRFEKAFAEALGVKHCIGTPGCNPALHCLAAAFDFEPGDEIIVSPITDYGSISGLICENYIPVFPDVEPGTVNLSARTIEPCITDRTRAILVVHKTGIICDMDPIMELANKHDLIVYEDACQAVFGRYKGRLAGTLADAAAFSFDSEKTMGSDVGGCLVTDDDDLAERVRFMGQSRGAVKEPGFGRKHIKRGYAFRMPHCTAAMCLGQLEIIRDQVTHRDRMYRLLAGLLEDVPGVQALAVPDYVDVYSPWMFSMNIDLDRFDCSADQFAKELVADGIPNAGTGRYYLMPVGATFLNETPRIRSIPIPCRPPRENTPTTKLPAPMRGNSCKAGSAGPPSAKNTSRKTAPGPPKSSRMSRTGIVFSNAPLPHFIPHPISHS